MRLGERITQFSPLIGIADDNYVSLITRFMLRNAVSVHCAAVHMCDASAISKDK